MLSALHYALYARELKGIKSLATAVVWHQITVSQDKSLQDDEWTEGERRAAVIRRCPIHVYTGTYVSFQWTPLQPNNYSLVEADT